MYPAVQNDGEMYIIEGAHALIFDIALQKFQLALNKKTPNSKPQMPSFPHLMSSIIIIYLAYCIVITYY